jgi:biotin synthase
MSYFVKTMEEKVMDGQSISFQEAMQLARTEHVEALFTSADRIREKYRGKRMDLCTIMNAKSGKCPENCRFCAQSDHYSTGVEVYPLVGLDKVLKMAGEAELEGVHRFSLITSGGALSKADFDDVVDMIEVLKRETRLSLCASLGSISIDQALRLKEAGLTMYHHNVETSRDNFNSICDTHSYEDRVTTIKNVISTGLEPCSGGIIGMGEGLEQRVKMAFEIRDLGVRSIPLNILTPIPGTPLENMERLDPMEILRTISVFRFVIPDASLRYAGGRNAFGEWQRKGFRAGISAVMVGNYLTTPGNKIVDDLKMIKGLGFEV